LIEILNCCYRCCHQATFLHETQNTSVGEGFDCLHFEYRNLAWVR